MSKPLLVAIVALVFIGLFLLLRAVMKRNSGGYQRRFATRHDFRNQPSSNDDAAFPIASTLFVPDGGSHAHHHAAVDCGHHADAGAGCSDGGGGSH